MHIDGPQPPNTVAVNLIHRIVRAAVEHGASRPVLIERLSVDEARLRHPLARLPGMMLVRLLEIIDEELGDPASVLRVAFAARPSCFSDMGFISRYSHDLRTVLETNIRNQILRQNIFLTRFEDGDDPGALVWDIDESNVREYAPALELAVGTYVRLCREILGDLPHLAEIRFRHRPRFDPQQYETVFQCPVHFGSDITSMRFHRGMVYQPAPRSNPALLTQGTMNYNKSANWLAAGREYCGHGYYYLSGELNKSPLTLERMAAAFGVNERTLRRRLEMEGMPFRALLDEVRRDMCLLYQMEGTRSLGEVALLLGYAELSAFTRAYRRWHGEPPSAQWSRRDRKAPVSYRPELSGDQSGLPPSL